MKPTPTEPQPVIPAPPELLEKMQRLFARPPVSFEVAKAQTDMVLKGRIDEPQSRPASSSGDLRKAG